MVFEGNVPTEHLRTSPQSSLVTSEEVQKSAVIFPSELLRENPAIHVTGSVLNGSNRSVSIRGNPSQYTLMFWNGFQMNDWLSPAGSAEAFEGSQEFSSVIRVYKGPQSLLYSPSAMGGVIDFSKSTDQNFLQLQSIGPLKSNGGGWRSSGEWHHIKTKNMEWGIGGSYFQVKEQSSLGAQGIQMEKSNLELDGVRQGTGSAYIKYLDVSKSVTEVEMIYHQRELVTDDDVAPYDDEDAVTKRTKNLIGGHLIFGVLPQTETKLQFDQQKNFLSSMNAPDADHEGFYLSENWGVKNSLRLTNRTRLHQHKLSWGGEWGWEEGDFFNRESGSMSSSFNRSRSETSLFIVDEWTSDSWGISAGLRNHWVKSLEDHADLPRLAGQILVQKHLTSGFSPYVLYSRGFKNPSLYQLYSLYGDDRLAQENAQSEEIGTEWSKNFGDEIASASISAFRSRFENMIDFDLQKFRYQNIKQSRIDGVDFDLSLSRGRSLFDLAYVRLRSIDLATNLVPLRQPQESAKFSWQYRWTDEWSQGLVVRHIGSREDYSAREVGGRIRLPSATLLNMNQSYNWREWTLSLRAENLLNTHYQEVFGYSATGRLWIFSLRRSL